MATITVSRPRLVGFGDSDDAMRVVVDTSGTTFVQNDLVTYGSTSGIDKATGGAADSDLALAVERDQSEDPYYEPVGGSAGSFGGDSGYAQVVSLENAQLEMSTANEALATADLGAIFALAYDSSAGAAVVDLSTSSTSGFKIIRVADPVFGGDVGDTGTRVVGTITSDLCL